jgi:RNase P/RNase MRP subunit p29
MSMESRKPKPGFLYILTHPDHEQLVKVGRTTQTVEKRLAQHNTRGITGEIVKETGKKWEIYHYIYVQDTVEAESMFWDTICLPRFNHEELLEIGTDGAMQVLNDCIKQLKKKPEPLPEKPEPLPDWVYAKTAWMKRRLEGRGITLVGYCRGPSGKSTFRCSNGHEWSRVSGNVAEGEGCPQCGVGAMDPEDIKQMIKTGYIYLLTHPEMPGTVKIGRTYRTLEQCLTAHNRDGITGRVVEETGKPWEIHRYRSVEDPVLAESLIWELLGYPRSNDRELIDIDLSIAEQAFRDFLPQMQRKIALAEKEKENAQKTE